MTAKTNTADEPPTGVVAALASVMEEVRNVAKNDFHNSPTAKFPFRGIDAVVNAVGPALRKHRVVVTPQLVSIDRRDVQTSGGKASRETTVVVKYVWTGPDGSTLDTIVPGEAMDNGDKGTAKAMSVAFRIALLQALCLPTDDADPDTHQYEREVPQQRHNGQQHPRNEGKPAVPPADSARSALRKECDDRKWDMKLVATEFSNRYGGADLRSETDAGRITAFTKLLPDVFATPATNGAGQ